MNLEQARRLCDEMMDLTRCKPRHAHLALQRAAQIGLLFQGAQAAEPATAVLACEEALRKWLSAGPLSADPESRRDSESMTRAIQRLRCAVESAFDVRTTRDETGLPDAPGWPLCPAN